MQIKDQIRARREQVGISLVDLAAKLGVTDQAVRHWESGRSNPGKRIAQQVEAVLDFQLDWSEGARHSGDKSTVNALIDQRDIDLLLVICRLPWDAKNLIGELARMHLAALERGPHTINDREDTRSIPPFLELKKDANRAANTTSQRATKREQTKPKTRAPARKAAG